MSTDRRVSIIVGANVREFMENIDRTQKKMERFSNKMDGVGNQLSAGLTLPILGAGGAAVRAAEQFETAFIGVQKTVDGTEAQMAGLRKGILDMSKEMPASAAEIATVAEAAGQLGIQTENILGFTKTMIQLGDSTNIAATDAATSLARLANVMQLPQDQFDQIGAAIVGLGNNFATTEAEIVEMSTRMAAAGNIAGMSASDVLALATALSSVGVNAESGGTAAQKAILAINDAVATGSEDLNTLSDTAGMSSDAFSQAWEQDAASAFESFIQGLARSGDRATTILNDLGLSNERSRTALLSLANAGDLLQRTLRTGATEFENNSALVTEAEKRYQSFASRMAMFRNRLFEMGVTIGEQLIPHIEDLMDHGERLIQWFSDLDSSTQRSILKWTLFAAALGPAIKGMSVMIRVGSRLMGVMQGLRALSMSTWFGVVATAFGVLATKAIIAQERVRSFRQEMENLREMEPLGTADEIDRVNQALVKLSEQIQNIQGGIDREGDMFGSKQRRIEELRQQAEQLAEIRDRIIDQMKARQDASAAEKEANEAALRQIEEIISGTEDANEQWLSIDQTLSKLKPAMEALPPVDSIFDPSQVSKVQMALEDIVATFESFSPDFDDKIAAPGSMKDLQDKMQGIEMEMQMTADPERIRALNIELSILRDKYENVRLTLEGTAPLMVYLEDVARTFTSSFGAGMANIVVQGEKLVDVLENIGKLLLSAGIQKFIEALLMGGLGGGGFFGSGGGILGSLFPKVFKANDALITDSGQIVQFHPDDNILAMKDFSKLNQHSAGGGMDVNTLVSALSRVRWKMDVDKGQIYAASVQGQSTYGR